MLNAARPVLPVATGGLPSRRAALASLAGLGAAAALPRLAGATDGATNPVVAELARLYQDAFQRRVEAVDLYCEAEGRRTRPACPEALFAQPGDPLSRCFGARPFNGRQWFGDEEQIGCLRGWDTSLMATSSWWQAPLARRNEVLAAYDSWQVALNADREAAGVPEAYARCNAASETEEAIRTRIIDLRSADPAALRLKSQIYVDSASYLDWRGDLDAAVRQGIEDEGGPWETAFAASIVRDIVTAHMGAQA